MLVTHVIDCRRGGGRFAVHEAPIVDGVGRNVMESRQCDSSAFDVLVG